jgi:poly(3-hydroxybutyrate) depolymerase
MRPSARACSALALFLSTAAASTAAEIPPLGSYDVKLDETSVSGISSGAYMAVQLAVARSAIVVGVGAIAGGPYACAQGKVSTALGPCMIGPPPDVAALRALADRSAAAGHVDDTSRLARQKVWILNGYNDGVVKKPVSDALAAFYDAAAGAGGRSGNLHYRDDLAAAHAQVTDSYGQACGRTGGDFINRCDGYDAAGSLLQFVHGRLRDRVRSERLSGKVLPFRQSEFHPDITSIGMDATGYVYVPASCAAGEPCRVHVAFHGCLQNALTIGSDYTAHAGYNEWADSNHLVVLYPQTVASGRVRNPLAHVPYNPNGCWDWWGYTGEAYARKDGAQVATVGRMLDRLAGRYTRWQSPAANEAQAMSLVALDASSSGVALAWTALPGARSYLLERASDPACSRFAEVAGATASGGSFADRGLAPGTRHCYRLRVVRRDGTTVTTAAVERTTTRARPAGCDPYVRSVAQHWKEGRTHLRWLKTYANGSDEYVGDIGPSSVFTQVLLLQTRPGAFVVGRVCE